MKNWFTSLNGMITLSAFALLAMLWSVFLDWRFVYGGWEPLSMNQSGLGALVFTAYFGGWIWALLVGTHGGRRALVASLIYAILLCAYAILDIVVACPTSCQKVWLYYIANWANLITGLLAVLAAGLHLRQTK